MMYYNDYRMSKYCKKGVIKLSGLIHSVYYSNDILKASTHHHDCHQLILILSGEAQICVNGEEKNAKGGSIIIVSRYENHSLKILSDNYSRIVLRLRPQPTNEQNKLFSLLSNRPTGFNNIIDVSDDFGHFKNLFSDILNEYENENNLKEEMLEALVNRLLISIYRTFPKKEDYLEAESLNLILKIQKKFEENYALSYTLEELAKQYNISVSSLSHQFKQLTGMSVMGYLLYCRIASAKNLLAKTNLPIGEIIYICGFSDNSNFSRTFKNLNGLTPTEFRKKYKNN